MIVTLACSAAAHGKKVGIFAPEYKQLSEPYDEIKAILSNIVTASSRNEGAIRTASDGKIDFWHLTDNPLAGRGREYDLILGDEMAFTKDSQMREIWQRSLVPTMATRPGARVWFFSTPNGVAPENFFHFIAHDEKECFKDFAAPSWVNPLVSQAWIDTEKERMHPDVFRQEILAEWVNWSGVAFFSMDKWLQDGLPVPTPAVCDFVFAVIDTATKTGSGNDGTAVTYYARNIYSGTPLVILDYDIIQIEGALLDTWLIEVFKNLEAFSRSCKARGGSRGVWIEDKSSGMVLLQQAKRRGLDAKAIAGAWMTKGKDERALSVSGYHYQGLCKLSGHAHDKVMVYKGTSANHLVSQVTSFRIGDKDAAKRADDLLDVYVHGLVLAFGDADEVTS